MDKKSNKDNLNLFQNNKITRRRFLGKIRKMAGLLTGFGLTAYIPFDLSGRSLFEEKSAPFVKSSHKWLKNPFKLGVASGDPLADGVVLWTRLVLDPLNGGGMPSEPVEVNWEMAEDESFSSIIKSGTSVADPQYAHSMHVEVDGLESNRWYYYRFKQGDEISQSGRTKTAPVPHDSIDQLNFAFVSCQNYPSGYYTVYDHLINEDIDLVFFLGDYIYEGDSQGHIGRGHKPQKQVVSLDDYRTRYAQYKSDPALQAAHAAFPWIMTIDDHEIKNDWAGLGPPYDDNEQFLARRAAAFQVYYEHMPLRKISVPDDIDMRLYRKFKYGDLAEFNVLDTRQFRTDFACDTSGTLQVCDERNDPARTILGSEQEKWLYNNLKNSSARWNVLPQQVMMAQWDRKNGPGTAFNMDKWDGYTATAV